MQDNKISVIIPCHNQACFLKDSFRSLYEQIPRIPDEIIVVDDSSTDNCELFVKNLQNLEENKSRIIYKRIDKKSTFKARKAGFMASSGNIICFLDADDMVEPDYFQKGLEVIKSHGCEIGIIYSDMQEFGEGSNFHSYPETGQVDKEFIQRRNCFHSASIVTRQAIEVSKAFEAPTPINLTADWHFWKQIMEIGFKAAKSPSLLLYRRHNSSMTTNFRTCSHYDDANLNLEKVTIISPFMKYAFEWIENQHWPRICSFGYYSSSEYELFINASRHVTTGFAFILREKEMPPLNCIESLMRGFTPETDWIDHESGASLVRRSQLFKYFLSRLNAATPFFLGY